MDLSGFVVFSAFGFLPPAAADTPGLLTATIALRMLLAWRHLAQARFCRSKPFKAGSQEFRWRFEGFDFRSRFSGLASV